MSEERKMEYQCEEALAIIGNILRKYNNGQVVYSARKAIDNIKNVLTFVKESEK